MSQIGSSAAMMWAEVISAVRPNVTGIYRRKVERLAVVLRDPRERDEVVRGVDRMRRVHPWREMGATLRAFLE